MKKTFTLTESDIKAVIAEKFKVDPKNVNILVEGDEDRYPGLVAYIVRIIVESEVQNYDL